MQVLSDPASEKAVLCALYRYGKDLYLDLCDIIHQPRTFTINHNQLLYSCMQYAYEKYEANTIDIALIHSAAKDLSLDHLLSQRECREHIEQVISFSIDSTNARTLAGKIRKLAIARTINEQLQIAQDKILGVSGNETASSIIGIAESSILDLNKLVSNDGVGPKRFSQHVYDYIEDKINNPIEQVGVSTGFPIWDNAIGGGLRGGTLNVIGARMKGFKSGIALNIGKHVAKMGIPVLYMDTELAFKEQMPRLVASESGVDIGEIETGKFAKSLSKVKDVRDVSKKILDMPFDHEQISGVSFEEQISMMRRWLYKVPKITSSGKANKCVIIYDYIKLMEQTGLNDIREYQLIGFLVTELHNFATKYDIPILAFVQLNRDGINNEDTAIVSQSDRILWFCSNFSIFKPKSEEEMVEDPTGNYKLVPKALRHGPGIAFKDYINVHVKGSCFQIREGKLKSEVMSMINSGAPDDDSDEAAVNF